MLNIDIKITKAVREIMEGVDALGYKVIRMDYGATPIDMGINRGESWKAGVLFTGASMGDMSMVTSGEFRLNEDYIFISVEALVGRPLIACIASQMAGWKLGDGEPATTGSGPARSIAHMDSGWYPGVTDYREEDNETVLYLQDMKYPTNQMAMEVTRACNVKPEDTYILISDSTCMVASVQVLGRMLEQACHRMFEKESDTRQTATIRGTVPIAPIVKDEVKSMGRIGDVLICGSSVETWVDASGEAIKKMIPGLVGKTSSPCYGQLFEGAFKKVGRDFFHVDRDAYSLGRIQAHNISMRRTFYGGEINYKVLGKSLPY